MRQFGVPFFKVAVLSAGVFAVMAFTPLAGLSMIFAFPLFFGWSGILLLLFACGTPFGGFLFLLIFSKREKILSDVAQLLGLWFGAVSGSVFGLTIAGDVSWT